MEHPARVNVKVRDLILDYALGASIVALLPVPNIDLLKAITLIVLNLFLIMGIARLWHFQKGGDLLARMGILFGIAGAILSAGFAWLGLFILAVLFRSPRLMVLAPGAMAFCYFWGIGQAVHHFYLSKAPRGMEQTDEI
ncbi:MULTISPECIES: hypothetical protein [Leptolyngbya]|uniref:hypothetical protein n=1 Tax=Leptolyngbya TaxID=47251 RepID=UPI001689E6E8|nr:hypothetical protein [Leptolyngbya sp. FACHB-1624]MBD1856554.1 hypothetical protein [Leptolyngbya sp. FACHB-1624]